MMIDWFTVIAQVFNFLILVWLMKRFLYKPILQAIDDREQRIVAELGNADKQKAEAQKEQEEFKRKNQEFDDQRTILLNQATDEVQAERQKLLDEAHQTAADLSFKMQEKLKNDELKLQQTIRSRVQQAVSDIARKALTDLAGVSLEERLAGVFVRKLRNLGEEEKQRLVSMFKASTSTVAIHTSSKLSQTQRASIENALQELFANKMQIQFAIVPALISGIELVTEGQKVAWNIADYLTSLDKDVAEILNEQDRHKNTTEIKAIEPTPEGV